MRRTAHVLLVLCFASPSFAQETPADVCAAPTPRAHAQSETKPTAGRQIVLRIRVTETDGECAKILSEPKIATLDGQTASFTTGGEFPVVVGQGEGAALEYRRFGTDLKVRPSLDEIGNLEIELKTRVVRLDEARAIRVDGQTYPGLRVTEFEATFKCLPGQTCECVADSDSDIRIAVTAELGAVVETAAAPRPRARR